MSRTEVLDMLMLLMDRNPYHHGNGNGDGIIFLALEGGRLWPFSHFLPLLSSCAAFGAHGSVW